MTSLLLSLLLGLNLLAAPGLAQNQTAPPAEHVLLSTTPGVPIVGRLTTISVYTFDVAVDHRYRWDLRARPVAGGESLPIALERVNGEPQFWQGTVTFPASGEWQLVVGDLQAEPWPAPGSTPGNVVVPVVGARSALAPHDVSAPWELVMVAGAVGTVLGAIMGWMMGRGRP